MPSSASSPSDEIGARGSKIFLSNGYVWTRRSPDIRMGKRRSAWQVGWDRAQSHWGETPPEARGGHRVGSGSAAAGATAVPRSKTVWFSVTQEDFGLLSSATTRAGMARGAFAAEVTLAATSGALAQGAPPLRETLDELMAAAGLVRRIGTNLNQAVAKLNRTGGVTMCRPQRSFACR